MPAELVGPAKALLRAGMLMEDVLAELAVHEPYDDLIPPHFRALNETSLLMRRWREHLGVAEDGADVTPPDRPRGGRRRG